MSSLVEVEPYSLAVAEPASPAEQNESRRETNLLQLAWQSRWLILLCMLVGAGSRVGDSATRHAVIPGSIADLR